MQMNYHKIINMKKLLILLGFLTFYCSIFGQYTGNKLPSGLTVSTTVDSADYTIIQKNGETIVKAVRMDTLKSFFSAGIIESIEPLDSISGFTGQFLISDGSGWAAPVSAKYEGNDAYTFGQRLSGAIGSGSIVLGRGRATAARAFTINGITASGVDAISMNGSTVSGTSSIGINGSNVSGSNSAGINGSTVSGNNSVAINYASASSSYSTAINGGSATADSSVAIQGAVSKYRVSVAIGGGSVTNAESSFAFGTRAITSHYKEVVIGSANDTATGGSKTSWVSTDRLFTIGNGQNNETRSNALVMLKNGNTTANGNWTFSDTIMADEGFIKNKAHGFYAFEDSAVVIDCTLNTWVQITNGTNDLFTAVQDNAGFTISGDTIYFSQPTLAGMIPHIVFHYGVDGFGGANEDYEVRVFNVSNNAGVKRKSEGTTDGANNRIEIGTTAYDNQAAFGDAYILQIVNKTNSNDFTIENGSVYLEVSHY